MGARRARKAFTADEEAPAIAPASSDEEEANRDLSLEIVERAKRRSVQTALGGGSPAKGKESVTEERKGRSGKKEKKKKKKKADVEEVVDDLEMKDSKKKKKKKKREKREEDCEVLEDVGFQGSEKRKEEEKKAEMVEVEAAAGDAGLNESNKKRKKKRKQRENGQNELHCGGVEVVDATNQEEGLLTAGKAYPAGSEDSSVTDLHESSDPDNDVLRKLLRIPRYFDTENTTWKVTCFNCGEEGHYGTKCTAEKRKKPCFLCGEFGHNSKHCPKGLECFVCKKVGHGAKDCTKKQNKGSQNLKMCLRCGENGHEMTFCTNDYSPEDLTQTLCYVCGKPGHLCCLNTTADASSIALSCYNCGQTGHTGFGCAKPRWQVSATVSTTVCHLCGEEGHFARGCTKRAESARRKKEASTPRRKYHNDTEFTAPRWNEYVSTPGRKLGRNRQYSGSRSAPHEWKIDDKKNTMQDQSKNARKPRIKSGWLMVDEVGTVSNKKHRANGWSSSSTPAHRLDFENCDPSSRKKQKLFSNTQRHLISVYH